MGRGSLADPGIPIDVQGNDRQQLEYLGPIHLHDVILPGKFGVHLLQPSVRQTEKRARASLLLPVFDFISQSSRNTVQGCSLAYDLLERKPFVLQERHKALLVDRPQCTGRNLDPDESIQLRNEDSLVLQVRLLNPLNLTLGVGNIVPNQRRLSR